MRSNFSTERIDNAKANFTSHTRQLRAYGRRFPAGAAHRQRRGCRSAHTIGFERSGGEITGVRKRFVKSRRICESDAQTRSNLRQLRAISGQARRCTRGLQYLRREERCRRRLVQGLGEEARRPKKSRKLGGTVQDAGESGGDLERPPPPCEQLADTRDYPLPK